jgi:hypothetical protein
MLHLSRPLHWFHILFRFRPFGGTPGDRIAAPGANDGAPKGGENPSATPRTGRWSDEGPGHPELTDVEASMMELP